MPNSDNSGNANRPHRSSPDTGPSPCNYQTSGPVHNDPLEPHASSYQSSEPQPGSSQEYFAPITPHKPGSRLKSSCTDSSQQHRSPQRPASAARPANFSITPLQFHSNSPTPYSTGSPSSPHSGTTTSTSPNQAGPSQRSCAYPQQGDNDFTHDLNMAKATSSSSPDHRATPSTSPNLADTSKGSHASPQLDSPINVVDGDDNPGSTSSSANSGSRATLAPSPSYPEGIPAPMQDRRPCLTVVDDHDIESQTAQAPQNDKVWFSRFFYVVVLALIVKKALLLYKTVWWLLSL